MGARTLFRKGFEVALVLLQPEDEPDITPHMNDWEIIHNMTVRHPMTPRKEREWLEKAYDDMDRNIPFGILRLKDDKLIGTMGLHRIDHRNRTAVTGAWLMPEAIGQGIGSEAKMLLLEYAFNALNLFIIRSHVIGSNERSRNYSLRCGYIEVGRVPSWHEQNGIRYDEVILTITREQWLPVWEEYQQIGHAPHRIR